MSKNTKGLIIDRILKQETYLPESGIYKQVEAGLQKLPGHTLEALELLLVFKQQEGYEQDRKVQSILTKVNPK